MNRKNLDTTQSHSTSPELICDQCHHVVPETFTVTTGQACGICALALEFSEIVDDLSSVYDPIYSQTPRSALPS